MLHSVDFKVKYINFRQEEAFLLNWFEYNCGIFQIYEDKYRIKQIGYKSFFLP